MADQPTKPTQKTSEVKLKTDWPKAFKDWAAGRTGFTPAELIDIFASAFHLTAAERKTLEGVLKPEPPTPPTPKPTTTPTPAPPKQPTVKPELIIARTPYPKWWKDSLNATINLTAPGSQVLATVAGKLRLFVATIALTVTGETQITFKFGDAGSSGPFYLGGEGQPMGIVIATGNSPAPCGHGSLEITATDPTAVTPSIGGFVTCFVVQET